ncbi:phage tail length tape measure family protein [Delftia sp. RIT313]|uniref:phage tail length tape measure family protein n=1 Tax=Delftia sp. RIT313 TaxID=1468410 RepID=UPI0004490918|nr:phage tail length tape measure family protein [Delftia sp. RIT313]EZP51380.1 Prophage tail length tape measure protein [Delftia sp. RIT313]
MASRSLGTLTLDLIAKIGGFTAGLTQAEREADKKAKAIAAKAKQIQKEWDAVGKAIGGAIAAIGIGSIFAKFIDESRNAQNEQAQLAAVIKSTGQAAGYSAQQLNEMASAIAGKSIFSEGDINRAQTRLLSYTNVVGEEFPEALQAAIDMATRLGMTVEQAAETVGKALDVPAEGLTALSKQGFRFTEDQKKLVASLQDTGRTAEAQKIILDSLKSSYGGAAEAARNTFGGAIAGLQNQLNSLMTGDDGSLEGTTKAINDLTDVLGSSETKQAFATFLTGLANIIRLLAEGTTAFINFGKFAGEAIGRAINGPDNPIEQLDGQISGLKQEIIALDKEIARPRKFSAGSGYDGIDDLQQRADSARKQLIELQKTRAGIIQMELNAPSTPAQTGTLPKPGRVAVKKTGSDDDTKKLLENELKEFQRIITAQTGLMADRNRMLDLYNSQGLISIKDYYDAQRAIIDESTEAQVKAYDAQIKALRDYQANASKKTDRAEAEGKINDLLDKRRKLLQDSGLAQIELDIKQEQSNKDLEDSLKKVNAQLLELRGQTAEAAAINFDMANEKMRDLFTNNNSQEGIKALDALRESTIAQANLNKLTKDFSVITADLSLMEQRIALDRENGAIGELEALQKTGEARRAKIALLQEEINKYLQIQQLSGLNDEQRQSFERLQFQLEQLNSVIDPVASRINTVVNDAAGDLFNDLITGSKSAKEAFEDFGNSIFREMTSLISKQLGKDLMESLFGGSSGSGGIGGLFSSLFGGGGGGKPSGGGFFDFLGGLFGGFRANGGPVQAGKFYEVNENENELFTQGGRTFLMSSGGGRVDPIRGGMGGGFNQVINFNHQGRIDRRTPDQIANETRRRTNTAVARLS